MFSPVMLILSICSIIIMLIVWVAISSIRAYKQDVYYNKLLVEEKELTYKIIAEELHDHIMQLIHSQTRILKQIQESMPSQYMDKVLEYQHIITASVTNITKAHHQKYFEMHGFDVVIAIVCEQLMQVYNIEILTDIDNRFSKDIVHNKSILVLRILQEAIRNSMKHTDANCLEISIQKSGAFYHINLKDNHKNKIRSAYSTGLGVESMYARAKILKASIVYDFETYTQLEIHLPIAHNTQ